MKIIIDKYANETIEVSTDIGIGENPPRYDEILQTLLTALDAYTTRYLESVTPKDKWKFRESLYDQIDYIFDEFLQKVFPEIKPNEFDLTPAAIVYAQDQIINEAAEKGISYKEAMKHYEKKAQQYIKERSRLN